MSSEKLLFSLYWIIGLKIYKKLYEKYLDYC